MVSSCGDRFIPNRSRFDSSQARASLLNRVNDQEETASSESEHKRQLRHALFGQEKKPSSLLGFGDSKEPSLSSSTDYEDIIPSLDSSPFSTPGVNKPFVGHRTVDTRPEDILDTTLYLPIAHDSPNLLSVGPAIAYAHYTKLVVVKGSGDYSKPLEVNRFRPVANQWITALKWNKSGRRLLAVGSEGGDALVLDPESGFSCTDFRQNGFKSGVTALEWKGSFDLVVASRCEIKRYDLRMPWSEIDTYPGVGANDAAPQLEWRDNILATAGADCVRLWDVRYFSNRKPLQEFRHEGVKGLGFCPLQRNVLATGGANGVKLWNVQSGSLRATIPTPEPVTSLTWSPYRKEIMASYGEVMAVWSLGFQVHRLARWEQKDNKASFGIGGHILSLDRCPDTGHVFSFHAYKCLGHWNPFGAPPTSQVPQKRATLSLGTLELPTIR
jgi:WD40 repeat protein